MTSDKTKDKDNEKPKDDEPTDGAQQRSGGGGQPRKP